MHFLATRTLITDPVLATLVDELAQASRIEAAHVGYAGSPSEVHGLFMRIIELASPQQAVALLRHDSAVVRGYLAKHVTATLPADLEAVYPLLADATQVEEMSGCNIGSTTVSQVALMALYAQCDQPAVQALLLHAAGDPRLGTLRTKALQYVAKQRPAEATAIATSLLHGSDSTLLAGAIRTLGITASSDSAPPLCALAGTAQNEIRAAVAAALGSLRHACVEPTLRRLTEDSDEYVRLNAGMSYVRTPEREIAVLRRLFRDSAPRVRTHTALALAELAGTQELVLLREYLSQEPSSSEVVTALCQARSDEVSAFMREVLTSRMGSDVLVRAQALGYLRDVADHQSLPLFLRALRSDYIGERTAAAEGIAAIGERGAASALSALLLDQNPHGRLAAARALVKLRAVDSRDSLHRAAASDTSWAKQEMAKLARQLGQPDQG